MTMEYFLSYIFIFQNLSSSLEKLSTFLGVALSADVESTLIKHLQKDESKVDDSLNQNDADDKGGELSPVIKVNPAANKPPHKEQGGAGGWRANMTPLSAEKFDKWTKEKLAGTDFSNVFMII